MGASATQKTGKDRRFRSAQATFRRPYQ